MSFWFVQAGKKARQFKTFKNVQACNFRRFRDEWNVRSTLRLRVWQRAPAWRSAGRRHQTALCLYYRQLRSPPALQIFCKYFKRWLRKTYIIAEQKVRVASWNILTRWCYFSAKSSVQDHETSVGGGRVQSDPYRVTIAIDKEAYW